MQFTIPQGTQAVMGIPIGKLNNLDHRVSALENGGVVSSSYQAPLTGSLNQATFTWTTAPKVIVVDGVPKQKTQTDGTVNWTGTTTTVLSVWPTFDIYAIC